MTRTRRLQPLVQHTDKKEQLALQAVAQSQAALDGEQARLAQLNDYKLEYLQKRKYDIGVFTPHELQEFNRFMQQLDRTIIRQTELVAQRVQELEHQRRLWTATKIDSKKMHKVVEKLQQQEFVEQERKEQKALDEFAQRNNKGR